MKNKYYYKDGTTSSEHDTSKALHRENGPAMEYADGYKAWYLDGKRHRVDGPAIENANGDSSWYVDDKRHRVDGPAIEYADGGRSWYIDDKRHNIDGPAIEWSNGTKSWYIDNEDYAEEDFNQLIAEVKQLPLALRLIDPREWVRKLQ